jgi:hypothetical protein
MVSVLLFPLTALALRRVAVPPPDERPADAVPEKTA